MIYVDSSVVVAHLLFEDRRPPAELWDASLVSSRLLEYEVWNVVHRRSSAEVHGDRARDLLERVDLLKLSPPMLERALDPFAVPLRTLDALHLASLDYLRTERGWRIELATYDRRMAAAAEAMGVPLFDLSAESGGDGD